MFNHKGEVDFRIDGSLRAITDFPLDKKSSTGCVQIWEHPYLEDGKVPDYMYIAGNDPYDHDQAHNGSLGSTLIYKRFYKPGLQYNVIVAEYTARPELADEYYENLRKLLLYYNARCLYENNIKGTHTYFKHKNSEYLLADSIETKDIIKNTVVKRGKGVHMTKEMISAGEKLIKKELLDYDGTHYGYQKIYSIPLLKELISYNIVGNFDRVRALMVLLLYKQELYNFEVKSVKKQEVFFPKMIFVKPPERFL